jgi:hypothetical protein
MAVELNDAGLPLAGRELDAWIAEHVMGWTDIRCHAALDDYVGKPLGIIEDGIYDDDGLVIAAYSTTSAFFKVMEARPWRWTFREKTDGLYVRLDWFACFWELNLPWTNYLNREAAYAHAVCCCVYLARKGDCLAVMPDEHGEPGGWVALADDNIHCPFCEGRQGL